MSDKKSVSKDDSHLADQNYRAYLRLRDNGHSDWVERAQKQSEFYLGDQWSKGDLDALAEEGRPALTMNAILSTVNTMLGELIDNQGDVHFKPQRGGSEETAMRINAIYQHVSHENSLAEMEQRLYADGIIEDRGFLDVRINYDENIFGDIGITLEDATQVLIDNQAKSPDPETWSEVIITRWLTSDEISVTYGADKAEQLNLSAQVGCFGEDSLEIVEGRQFGTNDGSEMTADGEEVIIRRVRVIERQYFKLDKVKAFVDGTTGDIREIPEHWDEERIRAMQEQNGLHVIEKIKRRVRMTITADRVLLFDDWSPYRTYTVVPFFPYFRRGKPLGVVKNLISPQELLNKTTSQELHIVNSTANSGWLIEEGSLSNMTEDELADQGSKTGLVLVHRRSSKAPEKISPNTMPTGIDRISLKASASIREISGVNAAMAGAVNAQSVSGVAIREQTQRGRVQAIVPEESLSWTRRKLALKIVELVQDFYTEGRIVYITDPMEPEEPRMPVMVNEMDEEGNVPHDVTIGRYDVVVGRMPSRDTQNEIEFAQLAQMRGDLGVQIPDHVIIEKSNLTNRRELARFIKDIQGFGELTPEQQERMQLEQELQMRQVEGEILHLEAKAEELRSRAMLNAARTESLDGHNEAALKLAAIEADLEKKREELRLRSELADRSYSGQERQNHRNNATKMALELLRGAAATKKSENP